MDLKDILSRCDHTLLKQESTWEQIKEVCDDALKFGCASVCIPPAYVKRANEYLGDRMKVCTVIGFPNGYSTTAVKAFETENAIRHGADRHGHQHRLGEVPAVGSAAGGDQGCEAELLWTDLEGDC